MKSWKKKLLKVCPICGRARRAGYFRACGRCYRILEYRVKLSGLLSQLRDLLEERKSAALSWKFTGPIVYLTVKLPVKAKVTEVTDRNPDAEEKTMIFSASAALSFNELWLSDKHAKKIMIETVKTLFEKVNEKANEQMDENGKVFTVADVPFPAAGNWRDD